MHASTPNPVVTFRERLKVGRASIEARYHESRNSYEMLARLCRLVDKLLVDVWHHFEFDEEWLLIAVGGYGRGQLYPASDIDILILHPENINDADRERTEQLIGFLWDIGLEIGHSVRSISECLEEAALDITVQTALLEARRLAGNNNTFFTFEQCVHTSLDPAAFFDAKQVEQQQRHDRFQGVTANLEPNVKESPGGLRDLHLLLWLARAAGLAPSWPAMARAGILTTSEAKQLHRCERTLQNFRIALHYKSHRREDRLAFEYQTPLAEFFGVESKPPKRASEILMQQYYRAARQVQSLTSILTQNLRMRVYSIVRGEPFPLNERFQRRSELLEMRDPQLFEKHPAALLEVFLLLQDHPEIQDIGAPTLRALWHARDQINADYRKNPEHKQLFLQLFRNGRGLTRTLRRMNQYGILSRYIPAFGRVVGQMQHDLFHVYTVDEHILMVLRNVRRFAINAFAHEYPLCSRLIMEFDKPELLYLAALFHDIAKGRGGDHSVLGKTDALRFCRSHGLPDADGQLVAWLVQEHLQMSLVAQKQDVYDPEVVATFAERVGDYRHLVALYLLTVADIRGTSPKVWNDWKAKLLEDLFKATQRKLSGENFDPNSYVACRQREARDLLNLYAIPENAENLFWRELDTVYFLRHKKREIAWHTRLLYSHVQAQEPIVRAKLIDNSNQGLQVLIYTPDQPHLFARICGFFEQTQFSIADAKIYTTRHGYALDTFTVFLPSDSGQHYRDLINFIEFELPKNITAADALPAPLSGRVSRHLKYFPLEPQIILSPDEKGAFCVLSIVAGDRPGLLSRITRILSLFGLNIHSARISTLGERAEDTFLVSGPSINDSKTTVRLEAELLQALRM